MPTPTPAEGQALVKVRAFGINRMDILQRHGKYPLPPQAPDTLGVEFSGTIDSFGPGAEGNHGFHAGDEVFGLAYGGAYAEYVAISTAMLIKKPQSMSWEVAASIPEVRPGILLHSLTDTLCSSLSLSLHPLDGSSKS